MVIQETLRLRPPASQVTRTAVADDVIDGYAIPAGANIVPLIYGIHHHPQIWDDPTRFDPERFAPEQAAQRHKLAWAPFGAGQRQCVGKDFAIMEAQIVLAMIVQRYALAAVPGRVATPRLAATLTPKGGVWVSLQPRS
jgi:cytochrome P450